MDPELKAHLDRTWELMAEHFEVLETRLTARIDQLEFNLTRRIDRLDAKLTDRMIRIERHLGMERSS